MSTEYLGITKAGEKVVVRNDGSHYRAFTLETAAEEQRGSAKIRFSDLSAELGLRMDGQRPETVSREIPGDQSREPGDKPVDPFHAKGVTKDGVKVDIIFNGTHYIAKNATGDFSGAVVGSPRVDLVTLGRELGITYVSEGSVPPPTKTEAEMEVARKRDKVEAEKKRALDEQRRAEEQLEAEIAEEEAKKRQAEIYPPLVDADGKPLAPAAGDAEAGEANADPAGVAGPLDSSAPERE